jgi:hypothetical protein
LERFSQGEQRTDFLHRKDGCASAFNVTFPVKPTFDPKKIVIGMYYLFCLVSSELTVGL